MTMTAKELGETSLRLTKEKDRDAWLALFTPDAVIEDPVGGSPRFGAGSEGHRGIEAITRFYDTTASAVDSLSYEIERSYLCGSEAAFVATFHMVVGGHRLDIDVVNIYTATDDGLLKSLRSYWDGTQQGK